MGSSIDERVLGAALAQNYLNDDHRVSEALLLEIILAYHDQVSISRNYFQKEGRVEAPLRQHAVLSKYTHGPPRHSDDASSVYSLPPSLIIDDASSLGTESYRPSPTLSHKSSFAQTSIATHPSSSRSVYAKDWFKPVTSPGKDLITSPPKIPEKAAHRPRNNSEDSTVEASTQTETAVASSQRHSRHNAPAIDTFHPAEVKVAVDTEAQELREMLQAVGKKRVARQKYMMTAFLISIK